MPADCNANGDIFGGWVMAQVDLAGAVIAGALRRGPHGHGGGERVHLQAAGAGGRHPVVLSAAHPHRPDLDHGDRSRSMPSASGSQGRYVKVTEATLTYVAIDDAGKPRAVPTAQESGSGSRDVGLAGKPSAQSGKS